MHAVHKPFDWCRPSVRTVNPVPLATVDLPTSIAYLYLKQEQQVRLTLSYSPNQQIATPAGSYHSRIDMGIGCMQLRRVFCLHRQGHLRLGIKLSFSSSVVYLRRSMSSLSSFVSFCSISRFVFASSCMLQNHVGGTNGIALGCGLHLKQ